MQSFTSVIKFISSGSFDNIFLGFLESAAVAMFAVISTAHPGFLKTFSCKLF